MTTAPLDTQIEAILFFRGEPTSLKKLAEYTGKDLSVINESIAVLENNIKDRGLVLVRNGDEISLGTNPNLSALIEEITKEELVRDIGKAGLETLAIIFYKGTASKKEIDYIRGVNSGFILRNLLIRGLVKREEHAGERGFIYKPTSELLAFMGISNSEEIPEFESMKKELETFLTASESSSNDEEN